MSAHQSYAPSILATLVLPVACAVFLGADLGGALVGAASTAMPGWGIAGALALLGSEAFGAAVTTVSCYAAICQLPDLVRGARAHSLGLLVGPAALIVAALRVGVIERAVVSRLLSGGAAAASQAAACVLIVVSGTLLELKLVAIGDDGEGVTAWTVTAAMVFGAVAAWVLGGDALPELALLGRLAQLLSGGGLGPLGRLLVWLRYERLIL